MPEGTRVSNCVEDVKKKQGGSATSPANAYAVCQESTGQSYATGKPTKGIKAMTKDAEALPEGGEIETGGEPREPEDMADEKYSAQLLRELHTDLGQFLQKYDEARGPLEHEEIDSMLEKYLQECVDKLEEIEDAFGKHHPDATPLEGGTKGEDTDEGGDEAVASDSAEPEEPTPEEAVEGMQKDPEEAKKPEKDEGHKSLSGAKTKSLRLAYGRKSACAECGKKPCTCKGKSLKAPRLKTKQAPGEEEHQKKPGEEKETLDGGPAPGGEEHQAKPSSDETGAEIPNEPGEEEHQEKPGLGFLEHEKGHIKEAGGFLDELSRTTDFADEHRMKAYHWHKNLGGIHDRLCKAFAEMDTQDEAVNIEGAEKGVPEEHERKIREQDRKMPKPIRDVMSPPKPSSPPKTGTKQFGEELLIPIAAEAISSKLREQNKAIKNASDYLGAISTTRDFGDRHRELAAAHAKALNPMLHEVQDEMGIGRDRQEEVEVNHPANEDIVPGEIDTKALKEQLIKKVEELNDKFSRLAGLRL